MGIETFNIYIGLAIAGIFTGLGSAIGNYFATKHIIENINKLKDKFKPKQKGGKK